MRSLKQQLLLLVIGPLILLSVCGSVITGLYIKDLALLATESKATGDLATGESIIDLMYPGPWQVRSGNLYKGDVKINNNFLPVDRISELTGDTVTIFLGDTRVSTTVRDKEGERAIGTRASDAVATTVLKNGQVYLGQANVVGELYQTAYKPIRDNDGKIIGMFYVGISKKLSDQLIYNPLVKMVFVTVGLTLLVAAGAWFFAQRVIIGPLKEITEGTMELATGHAYKKVEVSSSKEIADLADAFNQMVEGLQSFAVHISKNSAGAGESSGMPMLEQASLKNKEELPKGLNESTLKQVLAFLESKNMPMSAEEIGDGVSMTRVTARRYLEYLESIGRVDVEQKYGTVGRPVKLYSNTKKDSS